MLSNAKAVVFDIDGTLVDVFAVHIQSYQNVFERFTGIRVSDPDFFSSRFALGTDKKRGKARWIITDSNETRN